MRVTIPPWRLSGSHRRKPTDEDYERLVNAMQAYFTSVLATVNGANLMELDLKLNHSLFGLGIPMEQYNLLMDF
jgi:S-adenosylmethionine:diacylglycerol 3-amino-3-carboxypropyl transferase